MILFVCRLGSLVLSRYVMYEEQKLPKAMLTTGRMSNGGGEHGDESSDEDEEEEEEREEEGSTSVAVMRMVANFSKARHEAYKPSVLILLRAVALYSTHQFAENVNWLAPLLSRLVVCEDLEVRLCLRDIYRGNVSPLIIVK